MLSDLAIKRSKPRDKAYRIADSGGLYIEVRPSGSRLWYLKYRWGGKEKRLAFGTYPDVSLAFAREAARSAKDELRSGRDPSLTRKQRRVQAIGAETSLKSIASAWLELNAPRWTQKHRKDVSASLERLVFPQLGAIPMEAITSPMILEVLRRIEKTATETAHRVRQRISAIFCYGMAIGIVERDPAGDLKTLLKPVTKGRQPALLALEDVREMLHEVEISPAYPVTLLAFRFLALTAVRSGEVRGMRWDEVVGDIWTIPKERMKMRRPHTVCLSRQALEILDAVRPFSERSPIVFPSQRWAERPMSDMALSVLLKRTPFAGKHVPHGFRSSFSSIMNERRPEDRAVIDLMLAHEPKNAVEAAYNRALHLDARKAIAQEWADLLLEHAASAQDLASITRRR